MATNNTYNNFQNNPIKNANIKFYNNGQKNCIKKRFRLGLSESIESFFGRVQELKKLEDMLADNGQYVVICGMGGLGKTEMARKYAWKFEKRYDENIAWINSSTQDEIKMGFYELARKLDIRAANNRKERDIKIVVQDVYEYIDKHINSALFIFDNVESMRDIGPYLPRSIVKNKVNVLITSQNREWDEKIKIFKLDVLADKEAIELVKTEINVHEKDAKQLTSALQNLPLALQQAAAYIKDKKYEGSYTVKEYIQECDELIGRQREFPDTCVTDYGNTVRMSVEVTLKKINNGNSECSKLALYILYIMAYLYPNDIEENMFHTLLQDDNKSVLNTAIRRIVKFSLVSKMNVHYIDTSVYKLNIHRLVQTVLRSICKSQNMETKILLTALQISYEYLKLYSSELAKYNYNFRSVITHIEKSNYATIAYEYSQQLNKEKINFLCMLSYNGCHKVVKYIIENSKEQRAKKIINCINTYGVTPLIMAAEAGHTDIVEMLLKYGAFVNKKVKGGRTALHAAAKNGNTDTVIKLIELGSKVNTIDKLDSTALHKAAESGHNDIIIILINHGANLNYEDLYGWTALHEATANGHLNSVECLINRGIDINIKDQIGETALHKGAMLGQFEIVKYLIERGADVNIRDKSGETVFHEAAKAKYYDIVKFLVECRMDVNSKDELGETALHKAASFGRTNTVKYLIELGMDINIRNKSGETALHIATEEGRLDTVEYLIENDADFNIKNKFGETALDKAYKTKDDNSVQYLIGVGAYENCSETKDTVKSGQALGKIAVHTERTGEASIHYAALNMTATLGHQTKKKINEEIRTNVGKHFHLITETEVALPLGEFNINTVNYVTGTTIILKQAKNKNNRMY